MGKDLKGYCTAAGHCLKGIGKLLGNARRLLDSLCAIIKGYWKGKPLGNAKVTQIPAGRWAAVPMTACDEKSRK